MTVLVFFLALIAVAIFQNCGGFEVLSNSSRKKNAVSEKAHSKIELYREPTIYQDESDFKATGDGRVSDGLASSKPEPTSSKPLAIKYHSTAIVGELARIKITLRDAKGKILTGVVPEYTVTDTDSKNSYTPCPASDDKGISICSFYTTKSEVKTLELNKPEHVKGEMVWFQADSPDVEKSEIESPALGLADGSTEALIAVALKDKFGNPIQKMRPELQLRDEDSSTCGSTDEEGMSVCQFRTSFGGPVRISLSYPDIGLNDSHDLFFQPAQTKTSYIRAKQESVVASSGSEVDIEIGLFDSYSNPITGLMPSFSASGIGNETGECTSTDEPGIFACTLRSRKAGEKLLAITSPEMAGGYLNDSVVFLHGDLDTSKTVITASQNPILANATDYGQVNFSFFDFYDNSISDLDVIIGTTGNRNTVSPCSLVANSIYSCQISSNVAEEKVISLLQPFTRDEVAHLNFVAP